MLIFTNQIWQLFFFHAPFYLFHLSSTFLLILLFSFVLLLLFFIYFFPFFSLFCCFFLTLTSTLSPFNLTFLYYLHFHFLTFYLFLWYRHVISALSKVFITSAITNTQEAELNSGYDHETWKLKWSNFSMCRLCFWLQ